MTYLSVRPLAWLPNTHGFRFIGILKNGERVRCRVVKGEDGCYRVEGAQFADLTGWRDA